MNRRDFVKCCAVGATLSAFSPEVFAATTSRLVLPGIDVLELRGFQDLAGLRLGLLTNPAGVNSRGERTTDILVRAKSKGVRLLKLFGPEHGINGDEKAEKAVQNTHDKRTGLPVFSLYGSTRRPTPGMLAGLDAIVVDLQDVGCRSYTYVSCLRLVMEAAFEAGLRVIVLDRPNPAGGLLADGPGLDKEFESYVGMYPVPYVHGLTIGELARMAVRSGWLTLGEKARKTGRLTVIPMQGWKRRMSWHDTGLKWVPTSPMITTADAAIGYGMTGLGCIQGGFKHGYTGVFPFRWIGFSKKRAHDIARAFNDCGVPGLDVQERTMKDGGQGVYLSINNTPGSRPVEISFHMMRIACRWSGANAFRSLSGDPATLFNKHVGSRAWFNEIRAKGASADAKGFANRWAAEAANFRARAASHMLYS